MGPEQEDFRSYPEGKKPYKLQLLWMHMLSPGELFVPRIAKVQQVVYCTAFA